MRTLSLFAIAAMALSSGAMAQEGEAPTLSLELNSVESLDASCRLTFVAQNSLADDLDSVIFETVLFTRDGAVERLTLFDMQNLPQGRPRVRQFDVPGLVCTDLGRVLINGVNTCSGGAATTASCQDALRPASRVEDVEVIG